MPSSWVCGWLIDTNNVGLKWNRLFIYLILLVNNLDDIFDICPLIARNFAFQTVVDPLLSMATKNLSKVIVTDGKSGCWKVGRVNFSMLRVCPFSMRQKIARFMRNNVP